MKKKLRALAVLMLSFILLVHAPLSAMGIATGGRGGSTTSPTPTPPPSNPDPQPSNPNPNPNPQPSDPEPSDPDPGEGEGEGGGEGEGEGEPEQGTGCNHQIVVNVECCDTCDEIPFSTYTPKFTILHNTNALLAQVGRRVFYVPTLVDIPLNINDYVLHCRTFDGVEHNFALVYNGFFNTEAIATSYVVDPNGNSGQYYNSDEFNMSPQIGDRIDVYSAAHTSTLVYTGTDNNSALQRIGYDLLLTNEDFTYKQNANGGVDIDYVYEEAETTDLTMETVVMDLYKALGVFEYDFDFVFEEDPDFNPDQSPILQELHVITSTEGVKGLDASEAKCYVAVTRTNPTLYYKRFMNDGVQTGLQQGDFDEYSTIYHTARVLDRGETPTFAQFCNLAVALMNIYGESTITEEDKFRYKYSIEPYMQFPATISTVERKAIEYLLIKGIIDYKTVGNIKWTDPVSLLAEPLNANDYNYIITILDRISNPARRLSLPDPVLTDPVLNELGYVATNTITNGTLMNLETYNKSDIYLVDYLIEMDPSRDLNSWIVLKKNAKAQEVDLERTMVYDEDLDHNTMEATASNQNPSAAYSSNDYVRINSIMISTAGFKKLASRSDILELTGEGSTEYGYIFEGIETFNIDGVVKYFYHIAVDRRIGTDRHPSKFQIVPDTTGVSQYVDIVGNIGAGFTVNVKDPNLYEFVPADPEETQDTNKIYLLGARATAETVEGTYRGGVLLFKDPDYNECKDCKNPGVRHYVSVQTNSTNLNYICTGKLKKTEKYVKSLKKQFGENAVITVYHKAAPKVYHMSFQELGLPLTYQDEYQLYESTFVQMAVNDSAYITFYVKYNPEDAESKIVKFVSNDSYNSEYDNGHFTLRFLQQKVRNAVNGKELDFTPSPCSLDRDSDPISGVCIPATSMDGTKLLKFQFELRSGSPSQSSIYEAFGESYSEDGKGNIYSNDSVPRDAYYRGADGSLLISFNYLRDHGIVTSITETSPGIYVIVSDKFRNNVTINTELNYMIIGNTMISMYGNTNNDHVYIYKGSSDIYVDYRTVMGWGDTLRFQYLTYDSQLVVPTNLFGIADHKYSTNGNELTQIVHPGKIAVNDANVPITTFNPTGAFINTTVSLVTANFKGNTELTQYVGVNLMDSYALAPYMLVMHGDSAAQQATLFVWHMQGMRYTADNGTENGEAVEINDEEYEWTRNATNLFKSMTGIDISSIIPEDTAKQGYFLRSYVLDLDQINLRKSSKIGDGQSIFCIYRKMQRGDGALSTERVFGGIYYVPDSFSKSAHETIVHGDGVLANTTEKNNNPVHKCAITSITQAAHEDECAATDQWCSHIDRDEIYRDAFAKYVQVSGDPAPAKKGVAVRRLHNILPFATINTNKELCAYVQNKLKLRFNDLSGVDTAPSISVFDTNINKLAKLTTDANIDAVDENAWAVSTKIGTRTDDGRWIDEENLVITQVAPSALWANFKMLGNYDNLADITHGTVFYGTSLLKFYDGTQEHDVGWFYSIDHNKVPGPTYRGGQTHNNDFHDIKLEDDHLLISTTFLSYGRANVICVMGGDFEVAGFLARLNNTLQVILDTPRGAIDWSKYKFDRLVANLDSWSTVALIFVLNILPRIGMLLFMLLIILSLIANVRWWRKICHSTFDIYKALSLGHMTVDTVNTKQTFVISLICFTLFLMVCDGTLFNFMIFVAKFIIALYQR